MAQCKSFTLQEHAWLQTAIVHINERNELENGEVPDIEKVWPYAKCLYTPDTIEFVDGTDDGVASDDTIQSFNLHLTKDKVKNHLLLKCNCTYNTIAPFFSTKTNYNALQSTKSKEPNTEPNTETDKEPDMELDKHFKCLYMECLKRIVCANQFNGGPLQYVNVATELVPLSSFQVRASTRKENKTLVQLGTLSSNVCVGATVKTIDSIVQNVGETNVSIRQHILDNPVVDKVELGFVMLTNTGTKEESSRTIYGNNPNMSTIQTHIKKSRAQGEPSTNTFLSILGTACSGTAGKTANDADVGVTIRWGEDDDIKLMSTVANNNSPNGSINSNVGTADSNSNDAEQIDGNVDTIVNTTSGMQTCIVNANNINWIAITFDSTDIKSRSNKIASWFHALPSFHSKVFTLPKKLERVQTAF
jgi:hypothetical protein